ncbi:hypothetical protein M413DRAFT_49122, partial [Hebeloma cylindrosporum]
DAEFQVVATSLVLSVPPIFAANPRAGVEELLDSMIMRYIAYNSSLQGVVLAHSNLSFTNKAAFIQRDCPFLVCSIAFDASVWSPRVGFKLCKSFLALLCSPDHISLLVHRTFNVSIPRHHIPTDTWEFEYGPAENDPEFGPSVQQATEEDEVTKDYTLSQDSGGRWVHRVTADVLGGNGALVEFTVIGLTVANEMLSLLGSLQPDPFSPRHVVQHNTEEEAGDDESVDQVEDEDGSESDPESDSDSEVETQQLLGKRK